MQGIRIGTLISILHHQSTYYCSCFGFMWEEHVFPYSKRVKGFRPSFRHFTYFRHNDTLQFLSMEGL